MVSSSVSSLISRHRAHYFPCSQVGGLLLFRFNLLPLADRPLVIASIAVTLRQYFTLTTPADPNHIAHPPPDELRLALLDASHRPNQGALDSDYHHHARPIDSQPLWFSGDAGQQLTLKHLVRLPKDTIVRPSTLPGTKAWINVRHVAEVEILYHVPRAGGKLGEQQRVAVVKPLEIYSVSRLGRFRNSQVGIGRHHIQS
jgi:hypothetical protein